MNAEIEFRRILDGLLDYWRQRHRRGRDRYQSALVLDPENVDPALRSEYDYAAGGVASLAMLARGELPTGQAE